MRPTLAGKVLFWLAAALVIPGMALGLSSDDGDPIWPDGLVLLGAGGAVLMLYGVLVCARRVAWIGEAGAGRPLLQGGILLAVGTACLGGGLLHLDPGGPWRLLTIPVILLVGFESMRTAFFRSREEVAAESAGLRRHSVISGTWLFALGWPLFLLWALGVVEL